MSSAAMTARPRHRAPLSRSRVKNSRAIDDGDQQQQRPRQPDGGDRRQRRREGAVGDVREAADHHVLRIAGDGRDAADVGGHGDREQIGHRVAAAAAASGSSDQRRQHQAHRVVDQEGREARRRRRSRRRAAPAGGGHARATQAVTRRKKPESRRLRDDDHHAEQQRDRLEIDRRGRPRRGVRVPVADHQAGAEERRAGAVEPRAGQPADGDDEIGRGEDECGGEHQFPFGWKRRRLTLCRHLADDNRKKDTVREQLRFARDRKRVFGFSRPLCYKRRGPC